MHDKVPRWCIIGPKAQNINHTLRIKWMSARNDWERNKLLTPASTAIGLPRWSNSDSSSSILLLIVDVILGIRALITDSKF
jgi:hypothetical protein